MGKSTINPFSMAMLVHQRVDVALKARCPMTPPFSPWFSRGPGWVPPSRLCPAWGWRSTHHSFRPLPHVSRMVRDIYPGSMDHLLTIYWPFMVILDKYGPFTSYFIFIQEKMLIQLSYFQLFYLFYPAWRLYACMCLFCLWVNPCVHSLIVDKWIRLIWFDVLWDRQDKVKTPDTV